MSPGRATAQVGVRNSVRETHMGLSFPFYKMEMMPKHHLYGNVFFQSISVEWDLDEWE